jgi:ACT domain-containing protein
MWEIISDVIRLLTAIAAVGAAVMSIINSRRIKEVHVSINSRMDQLLRATGAASKAEGIEQERAEQNHRTN